MNVRRGRLPVTGLRRIKLVEIVVVKSLQQPDSFTGSWLLLRELPRGSYRRLRLLSTSCRH